MAATASGLCSLVQQCSEGIAVTYPGSTFFIDPDGMNAYQLFFAFCVYGYVLYISADMIGDGAELLQLDKTYSDVVGSVVLPVLGAVPDGMMVLFSGIGPLAVAQENVAVGVGALAGSTIMLLTLPWILSVWGGKVDFKDGEYQYGGPKSSRDTLTGFTNNFFKQGVEYEKGVNNNSKIMIITSLTYFVIQIPALLVDDQKTKDEYKSDSDYLDAVVSESSGEHLWAAIGTICAIVFFCWYMYLQYTASGDNDDEARMPYAFFDVPPPKLQIEKVKQFGLKTHIDEFRKPFRKKGDATPGGGIAAPYSGFTVGIKSASIGSARSLGNNLNEPIGTPPLPTDLKKILVEFFEEASNWGKDNKIHEYDLAQVLEIIGLKFPRDELKQKFEKADLDKNGCLDQDEFLKFFTTIVTSEERLPWELQEGDEEEEDGDEMPEEFKGLNEKDQQKAIRYEACRQMGIGTLLVLLFSDPMVDVLSQIGKQTGIPAFYVSFLLAPMASNASELSASYKLACKKTKGSISDSLQCLVGAANMNNTYCLGIFLALIYVQGLAWKFTAETLSIFFVELGVGIIALQGQTQTVATGFVIFLMYPLSLVFVYALESFGLD